MGLWDWLRGGEEAPEESSVPPAPTEADVTVALDRTRAVLAEQHASPLIRARVARVDRLVRATLPRLSALGLGSADAYAVVATAIDYLPEAVGGYLRLPRDWADTRPIDGGRTALMVLVDQLELLGATMEKVLDAANRSDAQALVAHGQFLMAKFGTPSHGGVLNLAAGDPARGPLPVPGVTAPPSSAAPAAGTRRASGSSESEKPVARPAPPANTLDLEP